MTDPTEPVAVDPEAFDDLVRGRRSIRRFRPDPVPEATLRQLLETAARAPSGANMQPWQVHVVTGPARDRLVEAAVAAAQAGGETPEYNYYPTEWFEPYRSRRRTVGFGLYAKLGIAREDKAARARQFERNFRFFDAPVGLLVTVDRRLETGSWVDIGIFLGQLMLLARAHGLETCPQAAWGRVHDTVRSTLGFSGDQMLVCGVALGYPDWSAPENALETERAPLETWTRFHHD